MAKFYPDPPSSHSPNSELKVRKSLAKVKDIVVLHSVAWQSRRGKQQGDGEADFIVLIPGLGILVLEVKGGGIEVINGQWYSTGSDGIRHEIKNPFDQAKDSKYALLAYFRATDTTLSRIPIVHGVVFPDIKVKDSISMNSPRPIIIDTDDLNEPLDAITQIFKHWEKSHKLTPGEVDRIVEKLAPTIKIRRLLRDEIGEAEQGLIELTAEQVRVLQSLNRVRRALILGGAGTGKSVLAVEKSRKLSEAGFRTLLVCYNAPLRNYLSAVLNDTNVQVESFHSLSIREAKRSKLKIPNHPNDTWFEEEAPRLLTSAAESGDRQYDAILIDEAQDFSIDWLAATESLLEENGLLYLFADSHQDLYRRGWVQPNGVFEFELTINCRNTRQIAEKVAKIFGDKLDGPLVMGPQPRFIEIERQTQLVPYTTELISLLIREEGLSPENLVVLTDTSSLVSELRQTGVEDYLFTTLDGHGIPVDTIHRFKGLERDAVLLVISDRIPAEDLKSLAYVGLSRAKAGLYVVGSKNIKSALAWSS